MREISIRAAEKNKDKDPFSNLRKNAEKVERRLLDPELKLYCGDVLIEFRPGILKYELLRRLQEDSRLPQGLNEVGSVRVVAGSTSRSTTTTHSPMHWRVPSYIY